MRLDFSVGNFNQEQTHTQDPVDLQFTLFNCTVQFKI